MSDRALLAIFAAAFAAAGGIVVLLSHTKAPPAFTYLPLMTVAPSMSRPLSAIAFEPAGPAAVDVFDLDGGPPRGKRPIALYLHGRVDAEMVRLLRARIAAGRQPIKLVLLTSQGGYSVNDDEVSALLKRLKGARLRVRGECWSACASVALFSLPLTVEAGSRIALHQGRLSDDDWRPAWPAIRHYEARFRKRGLSESALQRFLVSTPRELVPLTASELEAIGAKVEG